MREFFWWCVSVLTSLSQVIQATIEKHKQNSETFRAFNSSFSQEEEHLPDSSVSTSALFSFAWTVLPTVKTYTANFKIVESCSGFLYDITGQHLHFSGSQMCISHSYSAMQVQNKLPGQFNARDPSGILSRLLAFFSRVGIIPQCYKCLAVWNVICVTGRFCSLLFLLGLFLWCYFIII